MWKFAYGRARPVRCALSAVCAPWIQRYPSYNTVVLDTGCVHVNCGVLTCPSRQLISQNRAKIYCFLCFLFGNALEVLACGLCPSLLGSVVQSRCTNVYSGRKEPPQSGCIPRPQGSGNKYSWPARSQQRPATPTWLHALCAPSMCIRLCVACAYVCVLPVCDVLLCVCNLSVVCVARAKCRCCLLLIC